MTAKVVAEFSRPIEIRRIAPTGSVETLRAEAAELAAIARRLDVAEALSLAARLTIQPWRGGGLKITGAITAELKRQSVISLQDFNETSEYLVERYFLPASQVERTSEDDDSKDVDTLTGETIDLGEIVLESLGLDLEPYPRKPGETFEGFNSESIAPEVVKPFADLSSLLKKGK